MKHMNMKYIPTLLAVASIAFTANANDADNKKPVRRSSTSTSARVVTENGKPDGEVVVTVNNDGKVETRRWRIGDLGTVRNLKLGVAPSKQKVTWLGIAMSRISDDVATQLPIPKGAGLRVRHILPKSPAANIDLAVDDLIIKIDDQIIFNEEQVQSLIRSRKPGSVVEVTYFRKGKKGAVKAKLTQQEMLVRAPANATQMIRRSATPSASEQETAKKIRALLQQKVADPRIRLDKSANSRAVVVDPQGKARVMERRNIDQQIQKQVNFVREQVRKQLIEAGVKKEQMEKILKSFNEALQKGNARRIPAVR
ncbi:MAG: hypothetical protein CMO80_00290 [Verrucomicrobiales bacterium]|nr:hypothetical protein [Verrucomicrobiales bacterium]